MPSRIVFGFGVPPSKLMMSIHHQALRFPEPPLYYFQPLELPRTLVEKSCAILRSNQVLGCHFADSVPVGNIDTLDRLGAGAQSSGRINCVYKDRQKLIGEDTLLVAASRALEESGFQIAGSRVLLLGTGFEAQSIVSSLAALGMSQLLVLHVSVDRARAVASTLKRDIPSLTVKMGGLLNENLQELLVDVDLLIIAIDPNDPQSKAFLPTSLQLPEGLLVFDLLPETSRLWRPQHSMRYIDGRSLVLWQHAECYRLWNQHDLPLELLQQAEYDAETGLL